MRTASILRRKPRTWRDRIAVRLHAVRVSAKRRWKRLNRNRHRRSAHLRAQDVFLQLERSLRRHPPEGAVRAHRGRLHVRHQR